MSTDPDYPRPLAWQHGRFRWNLQRIPRTLPDSTPHPGRTSAIFIVHGIGEQLWMETAAALRSGFEDALEKIRLAQTPEERERSEDLPSPFIYEGYWADYPQVDLTFPEDWKNFNEREQKFFVSLWRQRVISGLRTVLWYLRQQARLLSPHVLFKNPLAWFMYLPLQILFPITLLVGLLRYPRVITNYLTDVRLYSDPKGDVERVIAHRIDQRVGCELLRMIGLDWDFRLLPYDERILAGGERVVFKRVVWVAHSLGTVISYNVLSALFHKAAEIDAKGDEQQRAGVQRFRDSLRRFVTLGSPLDKLMFLFGKKCLVPWPSGSRRGFLEGGEKNEKESGESEWWVNFYHTFDPVSGALDDPDVRGDEPPSNYHIWSPSTWIPGYSHIAYWNDTKSLQFILSRTYGKEYLRHEAYPRPLSPFALTLIGALVWGVILFGALWLLREHWHPLLERLLIMLGQIS